MKEVVAIIVTYNGERYIKRCIGSIYNDENIKRIIVVDNNSNDETVDIIKRYFSSVDLVELDKNIGFGKANNIGFDLVKNEDREDHILLLNQDAVIDESSLAQLINILEKNTEYGIISPIHLYNNETIDKNFLHYLKKSKNTLFNDLISKGKVDHIYSVKFINAAIWLMNIKVIHMIGGFDPLFNHYGEDNDYVNRMIYHNMYIGVCPEIYGYHLRPQIKRRNRSYSGYLLTRDLIHMLNINYSMYRQFCYVLKKFIIRVLYNSKKLRFIKVYLSFANIYKIIKMLPRIMKHRNKNKIKQANYID